MKISTVFACDKAKEIARNLNVPIRPIKQFENKYLYKVGNFNFYGEDLVHLEFFNLMHVPFALSASINFFLDSTCLAVSENGRRKVINRLLRHINFWIFGKRSWLESGRKTVRAAWVIEFGAKEKERHCHALLHFHGKTPSEVPAETHWHLTQLSAETLEGFGIRKDMTVQMLAFGQAKCVSYFCKVEKGREYKQFDYSPGFFPIIERKFSPENANEMLPECVKKDPMPESYPMYASNLTDLII